MISAQIPGFVESSPATFIVRRVLFLRQDVEWISPEWREGGRGAGSYVLEAVKRENMDDEKCDRKLSKSLTREHIGRSNI